MTESTDHLIESGLTYIKSAFRRAQRGAIVRVTGKLLVIRAVHAMDPEEACIGTLMSTRFMNQVVDQRKGDIVLDALQDPRFVRLPPKCLQEFRSAICVPVPGDSGEVIGLLYADVVDAAGAFDYGDLSRADQFCRKLGQRMEELKRRAPPAPELPRRRPAAPRRRAGALAAVLLVALWALGWFLRGAGPPTAPSGMRPPAAAAPPEPAAVVRTFLRLAQRRMVVPAHRLLSHRLQADLPRAEFDRQLQASMSNHSRRVALREPTVEVVRRDPTTAEIAVGSGSNRWLWSLVLEDRTWKLDRLEGGPLGGAER